MLYYYKKIFYILSHHLQRVSDILRHLLRAEDGERKLVQLKKMQMKMTSYCYYNTILMASIAAIADRQ